VSWYCPSFRVYEDLENVEAQIKLLKLCPWNIGDKAWHLKWKRIVTIKEIFIPAMNAKECETIDYFYYLVIEESEDSIQPYEISKNIEINQLLYGG